MVSFGLRRAIEYDNQAARLHKLQVFVWGECY